MQYVITIPNWTIPSVNKLLNSHWAHAARIKSGAVQMIHAYAYNEKIPKATGKRRVEVAMTQKGRLPDPDNLQKVLNDALVTIGLLKDDSQDWLESTQVKLFRGPKQTVITLTEIA